MYSKKFLFYLYKINFNKIKPTINTPNFNQLIIHLTNQLPIFHKIKFITHIKLSTTHQTNKTFQIIHIILNTTHHLNQKNPLLTTNTLNTITSTNKLKNTHTLQKSNKTISKHLKKNIKYKNIFKLYKYIP